MAPGGTWQLSAWLLLFSGLSTASFRGREFLAVFPQNDAEGSYADIRLLLTSYTQPTQVSVRSHSGSFTHTIPLPPDQTLPLSIPGHTELVGNYRTSKTIFIQSTHDISVLFLNSKSYTAGATALLPLKMLGDEYFVVTPGWTTSGLKELAVATAKTSANIVLKVKAKIYYGGKRYSAGSTIRIYLKPYHSFQLQSNEDLSGTRITSDNPVAVFSGHICVQVNTGCDYVVEQLLPVSHWGRNYIVPPNPLQNNDDFAYVVAAEDSSITYNRGSSPITENMAAGEVRKFVVNYKTPLYLESTTAIQVVYFFTGAVNNGVKQDPFLLNIPPITSYCTAYRVSALPGYQSHLLLIARSADADTITFNHNAARTLSWQTIPGTDFSWVMVTMKNPTEIQSIEHHQTPFGLLVLGFQNYVGWGFAGLCGTDTSLSCEDLGCRERCEVVDGQPKCLQGIISTCWVTGGPHYHTFDGRTFDFMGACTYTLTKTCDSHPTLPVFSVEVKKEHRGNPKISYIDSVIVRIYDVTVGVVRSENGIVRVDNQRSHLPLSLAGGKLLLQQKGKSLLLQTDFKLNVLYDWEDRIVVKLPGTLSGKVCGICGNNNGDPNDDALTPHGNLTQDAVEFGQSWKVVNESRCCQDNCDGECGSCQQEKEEEYRGERWCGVLTSPSGPFERCHTTVDPNVYLKNCVYDLCVNDGLHLKLCQALQAYADHCQEEGIAVDDWRTSARCPLSCPQHSNHTACGPACPPTCNDAALPTTCSSSACVETCACHQGFIFDANQCIPHDECGCFFRDLLHGLGEEFWGDSTCTKRCVCDVESRRVVCQKGGCRAGEECRVEKGIQGCYPESYGTCAAVGTTHYETFDGGKFVFQGTCVYLFAGLCEKNQGLVDFQVLVQNGRHDKELLSSIALVVVKVYGKDIAISQDHPGKIMINDRLVNLPYHQSDKKIFISRGGREAVVETDFGLTVTFDWQSQVTVTVPSTYHNALCGLCGNYNRNPDDEMMMKNGQVTSNPNTLGHSWKETDIPGCVELSAVGCPMAMTRQQQKVSKRSCGLLLQADGPFRACHDYVDPVKYFQNCLHDFCLFPDEEGAVCSVIARYVDACHAVGVTVEGWRTGDFCSISCPANSHYTLCWQGCSQTCSSISTPPRCSQRCREGCACDKGFVLSGDECVHVSQCGCLHQGYYYKVEEIFYPAKQEECGCQAGGTVNCQKVSCPGDSEGKVIDGVFQCPPATLGTCTVTGDHHYITFDGMDVVISGSCSYVLTETCSGDNIKPFVVKIKKEAREKRKVSGIQTLSVEVYGSTLTLTRGKRAIVTVDAVSHHLPAILSKGRVQVHQHGLDVRIQTDFGLVILYDLLHHVTVTVPESYWDHLCGLCGNYNGQQDDDFLLPSGQQATNAVAFGSAWKTPDGSCSDECPQDICPVCTENKMVVLRKPNYCGILTVPKGPFDTCHQVINPTPFFQSCLHDVCLAKGDTQVLCQSVRSYVTACQEAGVVTEAWRRPSFCPLNCPPHSNYSLCTNLCPTSCAGHVDASSCPQRCAEGCPCEDGFTFDGHNCVLQEECGCFVDGRYYKPHEQVLKDNCQQRCVCVPGRGLTCADHSCTDDETCEIRDGRLDCVHQDPCKALRCRPKERCMVNDVEPKCVPSLVATCWAWGDPHYHTFDGLDFDFQGTCTYTMAEFCGNDTQLVPFKVESKNNIRDGVKTISYVSLANIKVYGHHISIRWRDVGKVRVNGVNTLLPATLEDGKVQLYQSGSSAILETDFGLRVTYDWKWRLHLELPSSYYKQTCGLCGNYNLKAEDDVPQGGTDLPALVGWAQRWNVPDDDDPFCWDYCEGICPVCEEEKRELYGGNSYCGLIRKTFQGPFKACHETVRPQEFYRNCLYDVCMSNGAKQILCQVLEAYSATCKKQGAAVTDWRTPSGCSLPCPQNSHYEACGNACPPTCTNRDAPSSCTQPCVETCACNEGYVLSGGQCVAVASCGCTHDGHYYRPGEEFWADEGCRSRCRCDTELGMVVCKESGCKSSERCSVEQGVRRCVAKGRSICVATGDPHYTTFDGRRYDFMGTCVYQLAGLCSSDPTLVPFTVTVENNNRGSHVVSFTKEVTLTIYNMSLSLSQEHPQKLKVDGILVDLPFNHGEKLQAFLRGLHGFIKTDFDLIVTFDWNSYARVILPNTYAGAVCGLCGNANGDPGDDFASPDSQQAPDEIQFADSWKVADVPGCSAACTGDCRVCTEEEKRPYRGDKHCGLLVKKRGPFAPCHDVIDPTPYFQDCLFDACLYKGHQESVCSIVTAYVTACQSQGVAIRRWRTAAFCSPVCPPNQHYELCGPPCPPTCSGQREAEECHAATGTACVEGCYCDAGFLASGAECVPVARCGCRHQGRYYQLGEEFYPQNDACERRCACRGAGAVECAQQGCGEDEECGVRDGVRGCHPREGCGRCQALGGGVYSTLDGLRLVVTGSCKRTMAEAEDDDPQRPLVPFAVEVEEEEEGGKGGPQIRQVTVTVRGVAIGMARGVPWEVTVSGERHLLPLTLEDLGVTVTQEGLHRLLRIQGGPRILYDGAAFALLLLPSPFRSRTRGLCGDFNGDPQNDLGGPPQDLGGSCTPPSLPPPPPDCPTPGPCGVLLDAAGPFGGCHEVVSPQSYVLGCRRLGCTPPDPQILCESLQGYAAACQAAGGQLRDWREAAGCALPCPPPSRYALCAPTCARHCAALAPAAPPCAPPPRCFEGCGCPPALRHHGPNCGPPGSCGCAQRGRYLQIGETVLSPDCRQSCTCRAAGAMECRPWGCPFGQACGLKDGVRACVEQPGRCTLAPATRFVTFDGANGDTVANGIYVVTALSDRGQPTWFRLLADVGDEGERPSVVALHLFTPQAFVTVKRDKKVWVNGVATTLPVEIPGMLNVTETQGTVQIERTPQLVVELSPAGEVTVTVTLTLSKKLYGFCGDFNGAAADDLRGPDGKLVGDAVAMAKAWRAPDFTH